MCIKCVSRKGKTMINFNQTKEPVNYIKSNTRTKRLITKSPKQSHMGGLHLKALQIHLEFGKRCFK